MVRVRTDRAAAGAWPALRGGLTCQQAPANGPAPHLRSARARPLAAGATCGTCWRAAPACAADEGGCRRRVRAR
eukprot:scaffold5376_cov338-Prasinococcus_capsulatus_cf.AAC.3